MRWHGESWQSSLAMGSWGSFANVPKGTEPGTAGPSYQPARKLQAPEVSRDIQHTWGSQWVGDDPQGPGALITFSQKAEHPPLPPMIKWLRLFP